MKRFAGWTVLFIAFVFGAIIASHYRADLRKARERVATGSQVAATACGPIEYGVAGTGRPVLMIHGAGGGFDQGLDFAGRLTGAGFRVIAPSRFGYLRTPRPADASPAAQADAHACLLDALGLAQVPVLGGSAGAPSAMQLCLRHPERCSSLTLVVPLARSEPVGPAQQPSGLQAFLMNATLRSDFLFWALSAGARDKMIETILATPPADLERVSDAERERVYGILARIEPIRPREAGLRNDGAIAQALPRYDLEALRVPTLAISVRDDLFRTWAGAQYTAAHVRGARFVGFETGGHVWAGHDDELWRAVAEFLAAPPTAAVQ